MLYTFVTFRSYLVVGIGTRNGRKTTERGDLPRAVVKLEKQNDKSKRFLADILYPARNLEFKEN